ncbi:hypothetical protein SAMN04488543_2231 [Friedmanniella luteola]|uniref:Tissue inhibitor of metalloproteinase n=1 Tax=Friedmanniella luteola TaxID=546871 RepID=A0A1H1UD90_9ACTN|nr:hypothetical protein [Friedmanniella luteola]SDS70462.1 hypothetical protein SAMN04488543_2231 [Friedmanniella luteola]
MTGASRLRAGLLALLLAVLGAAVLASPASACSCVRPADDPALFEQAAVVFVGTVVDDRRRGSTRTLTFAVERVFKGAATSQQQVRTHVEPATCGLGLEGAGPFLVQAGDTGRGLVADACGGTRPTARAAGAGGGHPPLPGGGPPSDVGPRLGAIAGVLAAAAAALTAVAVLQRRSGRSER